MESPMRSYSLLTGKSIISQRHMLSAGGSERKHTHISTKLRSLMSSLRVRLIILVLLALLPSFGVDIYTHLDSRHREALEVQAQALRLTRLASQSQAQLVDNTHQLLMMLAQLPQVNAASATTCNTVLVNVLQEYSAYSNLGVVNTKGELLCSALPWQDATNFVEKSWFKTTLQYRTFSFGDYEIDRQQGKPRLMMSYPVMGASGEITAMVFAAVDLHWLNHMGSAAQLPPGSTFTVIDRNGTILARHPDPEGWMGRSAPEQALVQTILRQHQEGTLKAAGLDGVQRLYAFTPLRRDLQGSMYVLVGVPKSIAFAKYDRILAFNLLGLAIVAALAIAAAWIGSDLLVLRCIQRLLRTTKLLAGGDLHVRTGLAHKPGEIGELAQAFDRMAESLEQSMRVRKWAEATLREREKRYRSVVNNLKEVLFQINQQGVWTFLNPAWTEITGFDIPMSIGTNFIDYIHPDDRDRTNAEFHQLLCGHKQACCQEVRYLTKDGGYRWLEFHAWLTLAGNGSVIGTSGTLTDITARKLAQAERDRLFEQLRRESEDLAALSTVTANAISTLDLDELLNVLLQRIVEVTKADIAVILLTEGDNLRLSASIGLNTDISSQFTVPIGQGFAGIIAATMQPLYLEDAQNDPRIISSAIKQYGVRTMLGVPLKRNGNLVGVLHVDWCRVHPQSQREIHLLEITAERCTMAILNAQLYQETKQLQEQLQLQIDRMPVGCILKDKDFRCTNWNPAASKIFGYSKAEVIGQSLLDLVVPNSAYSQVTAIMERLAQGDMKAHSVNENLTKDGQTIVCQWYNTPLKQGDGNIIGYLSMVEDITERKQAEEQLRQRTFYDALTGLPNRVLFLEVLQTAIEGRLKPENRSFAVLLLDLDRFQIVKSSLGHRVAEQLLVAIAQQLSTCLRPQDTIARVGSGEFAILLPDIADEKSAIASAETVHHALKLPFTLDGYEVFSTTSIGIALSTLTYDHPEDFLQAADTALHQAKLLGKSRNVVFHPSMYYGAVERLQLESDLLKAIEQQQFQVYYQPIVSIITGKIVGFEALVRWMHPTKGIISPTEFIPLAEDTGLISLIDRWVLREACRQLSCWQQKGGSLLSLIMSVNLSGLQLSQIGLIERIDRILQETGISGRNLKLEITESVMMGNSDVETNMLQQLKALGIKLSIDDFGTGYSSLSRLQQLPIDTLKIDRSFVNRIAVDNESLEIVRTIITLAHRLDMDVIVEGIETTQQLAQLESLQCEYGQGYFFSAPVDSDAALQLILNQ